MKMLFLIHSLSMGGAERVTSSLANYWVEKGWQVMVATLATAENDFYALHPAIERIPLNIARSSPNITRAIVNNVCAFNAVRVLLKRRRPDVAVGMMTTANVLLALSGMGLPGNRIGSEHVHPPMFPLGKVWALLRKFSYGKLDAVVALTEASADWLRWRTMARRLSVIGNPISWPLPESAGIRDPAEFIRAGRRILLAAGRLVEQKGFDILLDAFAHNAPLLPEWDLVIMGEGPTRQTLQVQAERLGLAGRVVLPGLVGNIGDWYKAADLYVMSSRFEGFGNTLAEAMAYGLPAVSFDCPTGPSDIIRNEVDGLLVPHMDVTALAQALARLMRDEGLRERMACRALDVRDRFAVERIAGMWEKLFGELVCE